MRKLVTIALFFSIALGITACSSVAQVGGQKATPTAMPAVKLTNKIVAEGKVVPARSVQLGFQIAGIVAEVPVVVGQLVQKDQVLARIDSRQLELQLAQAEASLASTQTTYDRLFNPDPNEVITLKTDMDKTKALVDRAQAAYDRIGGDSAPFSGMTMERANLQTAWLDYMRAQSLYNAKIHPSDIAVKQAKANVDASRSARDLIADQLTRVKITAPFSGTVSTLDIHQGEEAIVGTPVMRLADYSNLQIETTDLTEINIVNVHEGDTATITFDAIPDLELSGKVDSIRGYGENKQGDIVYTVVIKLDKQDERLRWNMTAKVSIAR